MKLFNIYVTSGGLALVVLWALPRLYRFLRNQYKARTGGYKPLPSYPHVDPVLGLDLFLKRKQALKDGNNFAKRAEEFRSVGKTFQCLELGRIVISTMDSENIQAVLATDFGSFQVDRMRSAVADRLIGSGIFTSDGDAWRAARNRVQPIFNLAQITDVNAFSVYYKQFRAELPDDETVVDLAPLLQRMLLNFSSEFMFGVPVGELFPHKSNDKSGSDIDTFEALLGKCRMLMGQRMRLGVFHSLWNWDHKWRSSVGQLRAWVEDLIRKAAHDREKGDVQGTPLGQGRKLCVLVNELFDVSAGPDEVYSQLMNVYFPARDSVAIATTDILFHLARHPRVWTKLRNEVLAHADIKGPQFTYESLKSMKYLQSILNEGLRLHAPAGRSIRESRCDTVLPVGGGSDGKSPVYVPSGTRIDVNFMAMHRDPDFWGSDAETFRPERWEALRPGWHYIPFLGGPRTCPARNMALTQCGYIVAKLASEFAKLECADPEEKFIEEIASTMRSRNGCKVRLIK